MRFKLLYTAIAVGMLSLSACKQKTTAETAVSSDSVATVVDSQRLEMSSAEDLSLKVFSENLKTEHCSYETSIVLAQSKEHPHLATAINEWVNEQLGGKYEGDINDGQAMLNYYQERWCEKKMMISSMVSIISASPRCMRQTSISRSKPALIGISEEHMVVAACQVPLSARVTVVSL